MREKRWESVAWRHTNNVCNMLANELIVVALLGTISM